MAEQPRLAPLETMTEETLQKADIVGRRVDAVNVLLADLEAQRLAVCAHSKRHDTVLRDRRRTVKRTSVRGVRDAAGVQPDALCVGHLRQRAAEDAATIAELREVLQAREVQYQKALDIMYRKAEEDVARLTERINELTRPMGDGEYYTRSVGGWMDEVKQLEAEVARLTDELATCCLCEYEFDEPHTPTDRGRQVVCAKCWPHDADARGWKARAEAAHARAVIQEIADAHRPKEPR